MCSKAVSLIFMEDTVESIHWPLIYDESTYLTAVYFYLKKCQHLSPDGTNQRVIFVNNVLTSLAFDLWDGRDRCHLFHWKLSCISIYQYQHMHIAFRIIHMINFYPQTIYIYISKLYFYAFLYSIYQLNCMHASLINFHGDICISNFSIKVLV